MSRILLVSAAAIALAACAATHNKPSTAGAAAQHSVVGVRGDVTATHNAASDAQRSTAHAQALAEQQGRNLDQADRKNVLVRRWFELNEKFIWFTVRRWFELDDK
jgi:hypothetical protein